MESNFCKSELKVTRVTNLNSMLAITKRSTILHPITGERMAEVIHKDGCDYFYVYQEQDAIPVLRRLYKASVTDAKVFADSLVWIDNYNPNYPCYNNVA